MRSLQVKKEIFSVKGVFSISRSSVTSIEVVVVEISENGVIGRGECRPYQRYGETIEKTITQILSIREKLEQGLSREQLQLELPPSAARNAIDCALWDLEAKQSGRTVWQLAGLPEPGPVVTAYTISVADQQKMVEDAKKNAHRPILKVKVSNQAVVETLKAIRMACPHAKLLIDANEAWSLEDYQRITPQLKELDIAMIEQPLLAGKDESLSSLPHPVPLCADESCHDSNTLEKLQGHYEIINIKLDKTGGLTEAIKTAKKAKELGFEIMIGCMLSTSLSIAPAFLLSGYASFLDLDGPILLAEDRPSGLKFEGSNIFPPDRNFWG